MTFSLQMATDLILCRCDRVEPRSADGKDLAWVCASLPDLFQGRKQALSRTMCLVALGENGLAATLEPSGLCHLVF